MTSHTPAIYTQVGHTGAEELRFWRHRVFSDLLGKTTAAQMLVCGMTGRVLDPDDMLVIDDIVTAMSSADPRLWPFKITRLAAAHGSAAYGVGATLVASQGAIFGASHFQAVAEVVAGLHRRAVEGRLAEADLETMFQGRVLGFGILYGRHDARFDALAGQAEQRGRMERPFADAAMRAVRVARRLDLEPHVFVAIAALCLDLGMTTSQIGLVGMLLLFHDAVPNAAEGAQQRSPELQQLQPEQVRYIGRAARISERARQIAPGHSS